jgi:hypothetical protein
MASIYLGVLRGYSDSSDIGAYYMYFNYDSATRANGGNSTSVEFKNCYISASSVITTKVTTNNLYIDDVCIGNVSFGITGSWCGYTSSYKQGDKTIYVLNKTYDTSGSKKTKSVTVPIGTSSLTITLYGHRTGQATNAQVLTGTATFSAGWSNITNKPTINIKDHGNNTATISGTLSKSGTNNSVTASTLYYTTNGMAPAEGTTYTKSINLGSATDYEETVNLDTYDGTQICAIVYSKGEKGDVLNSGNVYGDAKFYSNPLMPIDIGISIDDNNYVTITATPGSRGSNNPITGIEIFYIVVEDEESDDMPDAQSNKYNGPFLINESSFVKVAARTTGSYKGNNEAFYRSGFNYYNSGVTAV